MLPANTLHPRADPLFILAGGPGQAASFLGPFAAALTGVRKDRDIVLVDQRGTGRSSPLVCAAFKPDDSLEATLELDPVPKAAACAQELAAQGVDAAQYTTAAWIADLDAVRAALGYDEDQPVGRLVRHARGARVPAPPSGPRAQRRARRRRAAVDEDPRSTSGRRAKRRSPRVLDACAQSPACARRASRSRRARSTRFATSSGREGATSR